ncbi:hypothetical protein YC2023_081204 [Brassica napus]
MTRQRRLLLSAKPSRKKRGSVPALTRDGDLWDSDFNDFQCFVIGTTPIFFYGDQRRKPLPPLVRCRSTSRSDHHRSRHVPHHHRSSLYTAVSHDPSETSPSLRKAKP